MKNVKAIIFIFIFGGLVMLVQASIINEFEDTSTSGLINLNALESIIKTIKIDRIGTIKNASILLTGTNETEQFLDLAENSGSSISNQVFLAQSFNQTRATTISIISLFIDRSGSPSNLNITLVEGADDSPSDTFLANATIIASEISTTERLWYNFSLSSTVNLKAGTRYWIKMNTTSFQEFNLFSWFHTSSDYPNGTAISQNGVIDDLALKYYGTSSNYSTNLTLDINGTKIYENLSNTPNNFNGTTIINLSASVINDLCNKNVCVIGINFTSFTDGAILFSNINITQNDIPNATNVSITEVPVSLGDTLKGHVNMTDPDNDNLGGTDTIWYINGTEIPDAKNNTQLKGGTGNVTELANITFSARVNDTYDWSIYVNSSTITVGDTTPPTITNESTQNKSSFTTSEKVNITAVIIDGAGTIDSVKATTNKSDVHTNHSMILLGNDLYQFADTFGEGDYNIPYIYAIDGSSNTRQVNTNLAFTSSTPTTTPSSGGGGGGQPTCSAGFVRNVTGVCINITQLQLTVFERTCNFNNICEPFRGEDFINCGDDQAGIFDVNGDCSFEVASVFCPAGGQCIWKGGLVSISKPQILKKSLCLCFEFLKIFFWD